MTTKTSISRTLLAAGVGATLVLGGGVAIAQSEDGTTTTEDGTTTDVLDVLTFNLEEERMARDLYDALGSEHDDLAPFVQIETSEQRHHDAVARLITLKDGTVPDEPAAGVYEDAEIQSLYDDWLERGLVSPEDAFQVGIELETADIEQLQSTIDEIDDADVDRVLGHLLTASEHHLAAFEAAAAGETPTGMGPQGMQQGPGPGTQDRPGIQQGPGPGMQDRPGVQDRQSQQDRHGLQPGQGKGQGLQDRQGMRQGGQRLGDGTGECLLTED